jgi:hypothetical protein
MASDALDEELACRPVGIEFLASFPHLREKSVFVAFQGNGLCHRLIECRFGQTQKLYPVDEVVNRPRLVDDLHYLASRHQSLRHCRRPIWCDSYADVRRDRIGVDLEALERQKQGGGGLLSSSGSF